MTNEEARTQTYTSAKLSTKNFTQSPDALQEASI